MSVTTELNRLAFVGDGTDNSPYAISFPLRDEDSVEVFYVTDSTGAEASKVRVTDYNITIADDFVTATLTLVTTAPATGETLVIRSNDPITRLSSYSNFDGQPSGTMNSDYDIGALRDRTLREQLDRAILVAKGHPLANLPLTPLNLIGAAGKHVIVNSGETDFELSTQLGLPQTHGDNLLIKTDGTDTGLMQVTGISIDDSDNVSGVGTLASGALTVTGAITATTTITATGIVTGATGSVFGNLTLADGSITDSGGAISFGNENLTTTGTLTVNSDTDGTTILGRAKIGDAAVVDSATFGHFDHFAATDYALRMESDGDVFLNCTSGQTLNIAIGGSGAMQLDGTDIRFLQPLKLLEQAADVASTTTSGQVWVKDDNPQTLRFTNGGNTEFEIVTVPISTGNLTVTGDLQVNGGDITSTSGAIAFGNENLSTTGTLASGALTVTGAISCTTTLTVDTTSQLTGNVKIGTVTAAAVNLHVQGGTSASANIRLENTEGYIQIGADGASLIVTLNDTVDTEEIFRASQTLVTWNLSGDDRDIRFEGTSDANMVYMNAGQNGTGFGTNNPAAKIGADQSSATANIPVLRLVQADVSEEFIRFQGTAASAVLTQSIVDEGDVTTATRQGFLKVHIIDDGNQITDQDYFMPIFTLA